MNSYSKYKRLLKLHPNSNVIWNNVGLYCIKPFGWSVYGVAENLYKASREYVIGEKLQGDTYNERGIYVKNVLVPYSFVDFLCVGDVINTINCKYNDQFTIMKFHIGSGFHDKLYVETIEMPQVYFPVTCCLNSFQTREHKLKVLLDKC